MKLCAYWCLEFVVGQLVQDEWLRLVRSQMKHYLKCSFHSNPLTSTEEGGYKLRLEILNVIGY